MWGQEFLWFFAIFHQEFRKNGCVPLFTHEAAQSVVYSAFADILSRPLPSRLRRLTQSGMSPPN